MLENTIWDEFFLDKNVRFPTLPKLIENISIYDAPHGLGIQFRGGPKKLIINGSNSSELFKVIKPMLNGENTLNQILSILKENYDINDVATILKLLHSHNLLNDANETEILHNISISHSQLSYFNRILGKTGYNTTSEQISNSLSETKVLLIASEGLIPSLLLNLNIAGIRNIGLMFHRSDDSLKEYDLYSPFNLISQTDITELDIESILTLLHLQVDNYQYIIVGFENPSQSFFISINDFCIDKKIPALFHCLIENVYEIGPYVLPKASSCYTCSILRKNSYKEDALFDNLYQDWLSSNKKIIDNDIKGVDQVTANAAAGLLISDFSKIVSGYSQPSLISHITEFDIMNGSINSFPVIRVPGCVSCSN